MVLTAKQKHDIKKFVSELERFRGRHTELVSVYIPQDYDMNKIINHLSQEQGTASNIKSAGTRKNVQDALERLIQHLRLFKRTPENGLLAYSGNVAEREGQSDIRVWSLEPPEPVKMRLYRCDKEFVLDILRDMVATREIYGLCVMDRREGILALLEGKSINVLAKSTSNVPGKTKAGGQSSQRFERLREGAAKEFYTRLGEHMKEQFLPRLPEIKGIIMGGPGPTKYDFVDGQFITADVKKKIIAIKDLSYTGEFGLQELVDRAQDVLAAEAVAHEKKVMTRFFEMLSTRERMVSIGEELSMRNLVIGAVDTLLLSESLDDATIEKFESEAASVGTTVEIISTETREGVQLKDIGRVAAILRYEVAG